VAVRAILSSGEHRLFRAVKGQDASPLHPCHVESERAPRLGDSGCPARNAGSLDPMSRKFHDVEPQVSR